MNAMKSLCCGIAVFSSRRNPAQTWEDTRHGHILKQIVFVIAWVGRFLDVITLRFLHIIWRCT